MDLSSFAIFANKCSTRSVEILCLCVCVCVCFLSLKQNETQLSKWQYHVIAWTQTPHWFKGLETGTNLHNLSDTGEMVCVSQSTFCIHVGKKCKM